MTALNKQALLIENGQLVADTLRHLADNEIDSDYFAITSTNENGTEIDHELVITDYALQAAGTVDELVRALEAAENNLIDSECHVAELEESLRDKQALLEAAEKRVAEQNKTLMAARSYVKSHAAGDGHAFGVLQAIDRAAGIGVKGE